MGSKIWAAWFPGMAVSPNSRAALSSETFQAPEATASTQGRCQIIHGQPEGVIEESIHRLFNTCSAVAAAQPVPTLANALMASSRTLG